MNYLDGIIISLLAGLLTGTFMWPMKKIKRLSFEHYWFIGMLAGLILLPWIIIFATVPSPLEVYRSVGRPLLTANILSVGWGIANVLYGICIVHIGAAIAGAVLTSFGILVGVTMPLIFKGSGLFENAPGLFSPSGMMILSGLIVIVFGVTFMGKAGILREKEHDKNSSTLLKNKKFIHGLVLSILAGILSSCISLTFVYSQGPVVEAFMQQGASKIIANVAVWAGGLFGGALVNLVYPLYLMIRNRNMHVLFRPNREILLAAIIGIQLITGAFMLGRGMVLLGILGASVGFGIQQGMQIIGNQVVGFGSGEWRNITRRTRNFMYTGIILVLVAIVILSYAN